MAESGRSASAFSGSRFGRSPGADSRIAWVFVFLALYLSGNAAKILPGTLEGYSAPYAQAGSFEHNLKILQSWSNDLEDLKSSLPRIAQIPALLIWGTLDRAVNPASAYELKQQFQKSRLVM